MYPLKLKPVFKDYIWGGYGLSEKFSMDCKGKIAEAWLMSCCEDGQTTVENGIFKDCLLSEVVEKYPQSVGRNYLNKKFPLIIKFIDAYDKLSVQVHPSCKNEMWYVLDCEENSSVLCGLKKDISETEFISHIKNDTATDVMNEIKVKKGDVIYIPAGTLHAIGKGILIAEIQQNSNVTYRVYDYNRKDSDGKSRPLHIKQALEVMNFNKTGELCSSPCYHGNIKKICECEYFKVSEISIEDTLVIHNDMDSFSSLVVIEGEGTVKETSEIKAEKFRKGDSFFLASGCDYKIDGKSKIILTKV